MKAFVFEEVNWKSARMASDPSSQVGFPVDGFLAQTSDRDSLIVAMVPTGILLAVVVFLIVYSMIRLNYRCFCRRRMGDVWVNDTRADFISGGHVIDLNCCSVVRLNTDEDHVIIVRDVTSLGRVDSDSMCVICFENFTTHATLQLSCSHVFHGDCIVTWLRNRRSCPLCKRVVDVTLIEKSNEVTTFNEGNGIYGILSGRSFYGTNYGSFL